MTGSGRVLLYDAAKAIGNRAMQQPFQSVRQVTLVFASEQDAAFMRT